MSPGESPAGGHRENPGEIYRENSRANQIETKVSLEGAAVGSGSWRKRSWNHALRGLAGL